MQVSTPHLVKCKVCPQFFEQKNSMHSICSPKCALKLPTLNRKAERLAKKHAHQNVLRRREAIKTRSEYLSEAQTVINRYVRFRDHGLGCISCGSHPAERFGGAMDCGHYLSRGASPHLRFNLWNMAAQCVKCNRYRAGSAGNFRLGLIARQGLAKVEAIESMQGPAKFTIEYLKRLKAVFARKCRRLEKRR